MFRNSSLQFLLKSTDNNPCFASMCIVHPIQKYRFAHIREFRTD